MKKNLDGYILTFLIIIFSGAPLNAAFVSYSSQADFFADISALGLATPQTLNFDSMAAGTTIPGGGTVEGVTFTYALDGYDILVDSGFSTTSGSNYIGVDDGSGAFLFGDKFTMTFDQPVHAVGLYVIAEPDAALAGDFVLIAGAGSGFVSNAGVPAQFLTDGDAYFLGLIQNDTNPGFSKATLSPTFVPDPAEEWFAFTVDDITTAPIPLPPTVLLILSGVVILAGLRRRSKKFS